MLSEKNVRRIVFKLVSSVVACAMILNDLSFAAAEPIRHLSPPSRFKPIVTVVNGIRDEISVSINPEIEPEFAAAKKTFQVRIQKNNVYQRLIGAADIEDVLTEVLKNSYDSFIDRFEDMRAKSSDMFTGIVTLEAYYENDNLIINVIDNGKPIELLENGTPKHRTKDNSASHLKKHFGGLGRGLILSKQALTTLGGTMKWYPLKDGTKTEIRIPKNNLAREHVIKPDEFIVIATEPDKAFREKAAFRDISILIGKYLRIGISEHTLKRHIKNHIANLQKFITGIKDNVPASERTWSGESDPILKGFAIDELTYNEKDNAFLLPLYRNGKKAFIYKYYIDGNAKDADMVIPLGDETDVRIKVEAVETKALAAGKKDEAVKARPTDDMILAVIEAEKEYFKDSIEDLLLESPEAAVTDAKRILDHIEALKRNNNDFLDRQPEVGKAYEMLRQELASFIDEADALLEADETEGAAYKSDDEEGDTEDEATGDEEPTDTPAGSIPGLFDYLFKQKEPLSAKEIAAGLGRSYETIKYDLRALYRHLRLIDKAKERAGQEEARYYISDIVRKNAGQIMPLLKRFVRSDLRPTKALLELSHEIFIRPIFTPPEVSIRDVTAINRIEQKFSTYYAEILRCLEAMGDRKWMGESAYFAKRTASYQQTLELINTQLINNFNRYCVAGTPRAQRYIEFNNMIVRMKQDLRAVNFKAERFLQNGEFDTLFKPLYAREEELKKLGMDDEKREELSILFKALVDRLENHILIDIENTIDREYRRQGLTGLKGRVALLSDSIETIRSKLPSIDIERILSDQFILARRAERLLMEIKEEIYAVDMTALIRKLTLNHDLALAEPINIRELMDLGAIPSARRLPDGELKTFMCSIEESAPENPPTKGSPEEAMLEFGLPQLRMMLNVPGLSWDKVEKLSIQADREWEKLGSTRRVWADETTGILRVSYKEPSGGWGRIPVLTWAAEMVGYKLGVSRNNTSTAQSILEQGIFWGATLVFAPVMGNLWATAIAWSTFFLLHFARTKNMPQAPPWHKILTIASMNALALAIPASYGITQLAAGFALTTWAHLILNREKAALPKKPLPEITITDTEKAISRHILAALGADRQRLSWRAIKNDFSIARIPVKRLNRQAVKTAFDLRKATEPGGDLLVISYKKIPVLLCLREAGGVAYTIYLYEYYDIDAAAKGFLSSQAEEILPQNDVKHAVYSNHSIPYVHLILGPKGEFLVFELEGTTNSLKIPVLPNVFPGAWASSRIAVRAAEKFARREMDVLIEGSGQGTEAAMAAMKGARVEAVDIKEMAVENTRLTCSVTGVGVNAHTSDLFDGLGSGARYDLIIFNMPHTLLEKDAARYEKQDVERSMDSHFASNLVDRNGELLERVARQISGRLKEGGTAVLVNRVSDAAFIKETLERHTGLKVSIDFTDEGDTSQAYIIRKGSAAAKPALPDTQAAGASYADMARPSLGKKIAAILAGIAIGIAVLMPFGLVQNIKTLKYYALAPIEIRNFSEDTSRKAEAEESYLVDDKTAYVPMFGRTATARDVALYTDGVSTCAALAIDDPSGNRHYLAHFTPACDMEEIRDSVAANFKDFTGLKIYILEGSYARIDDRGIFNPGAMRTIKNIYTALQELGIADKAMFVPANYSGGSRLLLYRGKLFFPVHPEDPPEIRRMKSIKPQSLSGPARTPPTLGWILFAQLLGVVIQSRAKAHKRFIPEFPFTPDNVRGIELTKKVITDRKEVRRLATALSDGMLQGGYKPELDRRGIPESLKMDKCTVFRLGRINVKCFEAKEYYNDKPVAAGESYSKKYVLSISRGDTVIGHGIISQYYHVAGMLGFRFSIHGNAFTRALRGFDFSGMGYGKEALSLIMAMAVNGGLFELPFNSFWYIHDREDERGTPEKAQNFRRMEGLLKKAGYNNTLSFDMASGDKQLERLERKPGSSDMSAPKGEAHPAGGGTFNEETRQRLLEAVAHFIRDIDKAPEAQLTKMERFVIDNIEKFEESDDASVLMSALVNIWIRLSKVSDVPAEIYKGRIGLLVNNIFALARLFDEKTHKEDVSLLIKYIEVAGIQDAGTLAEIGKDVAERTTKTESNEITPFIDYRLFETKSIVIPAINAKLDHLKLIAQQAAQNAATGKPGSSDLSKPRTAHGDEEGVDWWQYDLARIAEDRAKLRSAAAGKLTDEAAMLLEHPERSEWGTTLTPRIFHELYLYLARESDSTRPLDVLQKKLQRIVNNALWRKLSIAKDSEEDRFLSQFAFDVSGSSYHTVIPAFEASMEAIAGNERLLSAARSLLNACGVLYAQTAKFGLMVSEENESFATGDEHELTNPMEIIKRLAAVDDGMQRAMRELKYRHAIAGFVGPAFRLLAKDGRTEADVREAALHYKLAINYILAKDRMGELTTMQQFDIAATSEIDLRKADPDVLKEVVAGLAALEAQGVPGIPEIRKELKLTEIPADMKPGSSDMSKKKRAQVDENLFPDETYPTWSPSTGREFETKMIDCSSLWIAGAYERFYGHSRAVADEYADTGGEVPGFANGTNNPGMGMYVSSPETVIASFLEHVGVKEGDSLLDLGSGGGHLACFLANYFKIKVTGMEGEPRYAAFANILNEGLIRKGYLKKGDATFIEKDFTDNDVDFSQYSFIYFFAHGTYRGKGLAEKLRNVSEGTTIVIFGEFDAAVEESLYFDTSFEFEQLQETNESEDGRGDKMRVYRKKSAATRAKSVSSGMVTAKLAKIKRSRQGSWLSSFILAVSLVFIPGLAPLFIATNASAQEQSNALYTTHYPLYETSLPYIKLFQSSSVTNDFYGFTRSYQDDVPTNHTSAIGEYGASSYDLTILGRIQLHNNYSNVIDTFTTNWELGSNVDNQVFYFGNNYTNETGDAIQGLPFNFIRILGRGEEQGDWWNYWDWSVETGAAAELINLALDAHRQTGSTRYLNFATGLADVLIKLQDSDGGFRFAPIGVYHESGNRFFWNLKSTEKNERILFALENLYSVTNDSRFAQATSNLKGWLRSMYNPQEHLFHASAEYNGSEWVKSPLGATNEYFASDVTAMAPLEWMFQDAFFGATQTARDAEVAAMFDATDTRLAFKNAAGEPIFYRFSGSQTGNYGSAEFTAQMAVALLRAAQNYSQRDPDKCAQYLWRYQRLVLSLQNDFFKPASQDPSAKVAPYASYLDGSRAGGVPTGTGYNTEYYAAAHASVWLGFALSGFDPEKIDGGPGIPLTNPIITGIGSDAANADMLITIKDPPGVSHYDIYYRNNMLEPSWHLAQSDYPVSGSGTTQWRDDGTYTGTHPGQAGSRFYKVGVASNDLNKIIGGAQKFSNLSQPDAPKTLLPPSALYGRSKAAIFAGMPIGEELLRAGSFYLDRFLSGAFGIFNIAFVISHYLKNCKDVESKYAEWYSKTHAGRAPPKALIFFRALFATTALPVFTTLVSILTAQYVADPAIFFLINTALHSAINLFSIGEDNLIAPAAAANASRLPIASHDLIKAGEDDLAAGRYWVGNELIRFGRALEHIERELGRSIFEGDLRRSEIVRILRRAREISYTRNEVRLFARQVRELLEMLGNGRDAAHIISALRDEYQRIHNHRNLFDAALRRINDFVSGSHHAEIAELLRQIEVPKFFAFDIDLTLTRSDIDNFNHLARLLKEDDGSFMGIVTHRSVSFESREELEAEGLNVYENFFKGQLEQIGLKPDDYDFFIGLIITPRPKAEWEIESNPLSSSNFHWFVRTRDPEGRIREYIVPTESSYDGINKFAGVSTLANHFRDKFAADKSVSPRETEGLARQFLHRSVLVLADDDIKHAHLPVTGEPANESQRGLIGQYGVSSAKSGLSDLFRVARVVIDTSDTAKPKDGDRENAVFKFEKDVLAGLKELTDDPRYGVHTVTVNIKAHHIVDNIKDEDASASRKPGSSDISREKTGVSGEQIIAEATIDSKNRVAVPAQLAGEIAAPFYILGKGYDHCIGIYSAAEFEGKLRPFLGRSVSDQRNGQLLRAIGANSALIDHLSGDRRFTIPEYIMSTIGFSGRKVLFVRRNGKLEIRENPEMLSSTPPANLQKPGSSDMSARKDRGVPADSATDANRTLVLNLIDVTKRTFDGKVLGLILEKPDMAFDEASRLRDNLDRILKKYGMENDPAVRLQANALIADLDKVIEIAKPNAEASYPELVERDGHGRIRTVKDSFGNVWEEYHYGIFYDVVKLRNLKTGLMDIEVKSAAGESSIKLYKIIVGGKKGGLVDYYSNSHNITTMLVSDRNKGVGETVLNWLFKTAWRSGADHAGISGVANPALVHLGRKFIKEPGAMEPEERDLAIVEYAVMEADFDPFTQTGKELGTIKVSDGKIARADLPGNLSVTLEGDRVIVRDLSTGKEADVVILYKYPRRENIHGAPNPTFPLLRPDGAIERWQDGRKADSWTVYVLAAGYGKRADATIVKPKPMFEVAGRPIYTYVLDKIKAHGMNTILLTGFGAPTLEESVNKTYGKSAFRFIRVSEPGGTGLRLMNTGNEFLLILQKIKEDPAENILVINADDIYPNDNFIKEVTAKHSGIGGKAADATVLTVIKEKTGYFGRVIRDEEGRFIEIVEHTRWSGRDAITIGKGTAYEQTVPVSSILDIKEANTNVIAFKKSALLAALDGMEKRGGEFYIAEVLAEMVREGMAVQAIPLKDEDGFISCNTLQDIASAEAIVKTWPSSAPQPGTLARSKQKPGSSDMSREKKEKMNGYLVKSTDALFENYDRRNMMTPLSWLKTAVGITATIGSFTITGIDPVMVLGFSTVWIGLVIVRNVLADVVAKYGWDPRKIKPDAVRRKKLANDIFMSGLSALPIILVKQFGSNAIAGLCGNSMPINIILDIILVSIVGGMPNALQRIARRWPTHIALAAFSMSGIMSIGAYAVFALSYGLGLTSVIIPAAYTFAITRKIIGEIWMFVWERREMASRFREQAEKDENLNRPPLPKPGSSDMSAPRKSYPEQNRKMKIAAGSAEDIGHTALTPAKDKQKAEPFDYETFVIDARTGSRVPALVRESDGDGLIECQIDGERAGAFSYFTTHSANNRSSLVVANLNIRENSRRTNNDARDFQYVGSRLLQAAVRLSMLDAETLGAIRLTASESNRNAQAFYETFADMGLKSSRNIADSTITYYLGKEDAQRFIDGIEIRLATKKPGSSDMSRPKKPRASQQYETYLGASEEAEEEDKEHARMRNEKVAEILRCNLVGDKRQLSDTYLPYLERMAGDSDHVVREEAQEMLKIIRARLEAKEISNSGINEKDRIVFIHTPEGRDISRLQDAELLWSSPEFGGYYNAIKKNSKMEIDRKGLYQLSICLGEIESNMHKFSKGKPSFTGKLYRRTGEDKRRSYMLQYTYLQTGAVDDAEWRMIEENLRGYLRQGPGYLKGTEISHPTRERGVSYSNTGHGFATVGLLMEMTPVVLEYQKTETGLETTIWVELDGLFKPAVRPGAADDLASFPLWERLYRHSHQMSPGYISSRIAPSYEETGFGLFKYLKRLVKSKIGWKGWLERAPRILGLAVSSRTFSIAASFIVYSAARDIAIPVIAGVILANSIIFSLMHERQTFRQFAGRVAAGLVFNAVAFSGFILSMFAACAIAPDLPILYAIMFSATASLSSAVQAHRIWNRNAPTYLQASFDYGKYAEAKVKELVFGNKYPALTNYMASLDPETQADEARAAVTQAIALANDEKFQPCAINHRLIDSLVDACKRKPALVQLFGENIAMLLHRYKDPSTTGNKKIVAELIMKLDWASMESADIPAVTQYICKHIERSEIINTMKDFFGMWHDAVPSEWGTDLQGTDIELSKEKGIKLRAYDRNWYFVEVNSVLVGYLYAYHPTSSNTFSLNLHIFNKNYTRKGIGVAVMRWAASHVEPGSAIEFFGTPTNASVNFYLRCIKYGIFEKVEIADSNVSETSDKYWKSVRNKAEAKRAMTDSPAPKIRGIVAASIPENLNEADEDDEAQDADELSLDEKLKRDDEHWELGGMDHAAMHNYAIKQETGKEIVEIDISSPEDVVAALERKQAVALSLTNLAGQKSSYDDLYRAIMKVAGDLSDAFTGPKGMTPAGEAMKNAFSHGNRADFNKPIFINIKVDERAKKTILEIYDTASKEENAEARRAAYYAGLWGGGAGIKTIEHYLGAENFRMENARGIGTRAVLIFDFVKPASDFAHKATTEPYLEGIATRYIEDELARSLPKGAKVLDLMSGAFTYVPDSVKASEVVGMGLNAEELKANKRLTRYVTQDLNKTTEFPAEWEGHFDAVVITSGMAYMRDPEKVLSLAAKALKESGLLYLAFNPTYYNKEATKAWQMMDQRERAEFVIDSIKATRDFTGIEHQTKSYVGRFDLAQDLDIIVARRSEPAKETAAGSKGTPEIAARILNEFLDKVVYSRDVIPAEMQATIEGRKVTFTENSEPVESTSDDIYATALCTSCVPLICRARTASGWTNQIIHLRPSKFELEATIEEAKLGKRFDHIGESDCVFIIPYKPDFAALYKGVGEYLLKRYKNSKALFISIPGDREKAALIMKEGISIDSRVIIPGTKTARSVSRDIRTTGLSWDKVSSLLSTSTRATFIDFKDLPQAAPNIDNRPVEAELLHEAYVLNDMRIKTVVNAQNRPLRVLYGGAGADISNILLSTNATEMYFVSNYQNLGPEDLLKLEHEKYLRDGYKRAISSDYISNKYENGHAVGASLIRREDILGALAFELAAMGASRIRIDTKNGRPRISFEWAYQGDVVKQRSITLVDGNMTVPENYSDILSRGIDIYYQRAGQEIPYEYRSDKSFLFTIYEHLNNGGFFVTDDHAFDQYTINVEQEDKFTDMGSSFPIKMPEIAVPDNDISENTIAALFHNFKDKSKAIVRYGWYMRIRQKTTDKPGKPGSSDMSREKAVKPLITNWDDISNSEEKIKNAIRGQHGRVSFFVHPGQVYTTKDQKGVINPDYREADIYLANLKKALEAEEGVVFILGGNYKALKDVKTKAILIEIPSVPREPLPDTASSSTLGQYDPARWQEVVDTMKQLGVLSLSPFGGEEVRYMENGEILKGLGEEMGCLGGALYVMEKHFSEINTLPQLCFGLVNKQLAPISDDVLENAFNSKAVVSAVSKLDGLQGEFSAGKSELKAPKLILASSLSMEEQNKLKSWLIEKGMEFKPAGNYDEKIAGNKDSDAIVAYIDGEPVGLWSFIWRGDDVPLNVALDNGIWVDEPARRNGIGMALRNELVKYLKSLGYKEFRVNVDKTEGAQGFQQALKGSKGVHIEEADGLIEKVIIDLQEFETLAETPSPRSERIHAIELADTIKLIKAADAKEGHPVILALGTSCLKGYVRGTPQYSDLNRLITAIRNYCTIHHITFVSADDKNLLAEIEKKRQGAPNAKVIVLAAKDSIAPEKAILATLRDDENAFLAAVDNAALDETCYIRLMEMLRLALELGLKDIFQDKIDLANPHIKISALKDFRNVYVFMPKTERIPIYENLRALYRVQEFA